MFIVGLSPKIIGLSFGNCEQISFSVYLSLVYRKTVDFSMLIFYLANLLKVLISSKFSGRLSSVSCIELCT